MTDEGRRRSMREYQKRRAGGRRQHGLVTRTSWICGKDADAFAEAVRPFTEHARLMEGVNGTVKVSPMEMADIISEQKLPYDAEEMVFLSRIEENLALYPEKGERIINTAHRIMSKYPDANFEGVMSRIEGAAPSPDLETDPLSLEI